MKNTGHLIRIIPNDRHSNLPEIKMELINKALESLPNTFENEIAIWKKLVNEAPTFQSISQILSGLGHICSVKNQTEDNISKSLSIFESVLTEET